MSSFSRLFSLIVGPLAPARGYCHCSVCRHLSGAPFSCQALFQEDQVRAPKKSRQPTGPWTPFKKFEVSLELQPGASLAALRTSKGLGPGDSGGVVAGPSRFEAWSAAAAAPASPLCAAPCKEVGGCPVGPVGPALLCLIFVGTSCREARRCATGLARLLEGPRGRKRRADSEAHSAKKET